MLKACDQIEADLGAQGKGFGMSFRALGEAGVGVELGVFHADAQMVELDVAQDGGFDS